MTQPYPYNAEKLKLKFTPVYSDCLQKKIPKGSSHFSIKGEFKAKCINQRKGYFTQIKSIAYNEDSNNQKLLKGNELYSINV